MSTYTVAPKAYGPTIVRMGRTLVHIALVAAILAAVTLIMGAATWLYHRLFGGALLTLLAQLKKTALETYNDPFRLVPLTLVFFRRLHSGPHRFKVLIASDFVMIEGRWWWQHQYLRRCEVEFVTETPGGGPLMSPAGLAIGNQKNEIFIPAGAQNYEQIKSQISQWMPLATPTA